MTVTLFEQVDHRLRAALLAEFARRRGEPLDGVPRGVTVVLAGHRAAGKSTLLPQVARALGRDAVDLDGELARRSGRVLREWLTEDERSFREAERALFMSLPRGVVVAVGGGFLSLHRGALAGCLVVEVPITFATYAERLRADTTRPRLRPALSLEEELREVYAERTERHAQARPTSLVELALRLERGARARRVVTLPPGAALEPFAWAARHAGAELLEVRSDLHPPELDLLPASRALPLLVAQRTPTPLPAAWLKHATLVDTELPLPRGEGRMLMSFHSPKALRTDAALSQWPMLPEHTHLKHVEPLGAPSRFPEVLETQRALQQRFGADRVTVLVTGPTALPFRAVLAQRNALDYLALDATWSAAPGQRLLADAVREAKCARADGMTQRLGILGSSLRHSRSPRVHAQPFDRIDWPADTPMDELLDALAPHYRGFAVTNPFKKAVATYAGAKLSAVNTLVRAAMRVEVGARTPSEDVHASPPRTATPVESEAPTKLEHADASRVEAGEFTKSGDGLAAVARPHGREAWRAQNTDVEGARAVLEKLGATSLTVLGDGGVTVALREASGDRILKVLTRADFSEAREALTGAVVWTWPASVDAPESLRFHDARVAMVAYGAPGRKIAAAIRARGGTPVMLGARWFIAQARRQKALWESAP